MRTCCLAFLLVFVVLGPGSAGAQSGRQKVVRIAVILDGPWQRNDEVRSAFEKEILDLTEGEFRVEFPADKRAVGRWTTESVKSAFDRLMADRQVDMIIALGVIGSHVAGTLRSFRKPVLAPYVIDPILQGIPIKDGKSGQSNFSYVSFPDVLEADLRAFRELVGFERCTILTTAGYNEAIDGLAERAVKVAEKLGIQATLISVAESSAEALAAIPQDAEAVYLAALVRMPAEEISKLAEGLTARKLPSFSMMGLEDVQRGVLAGVSVGLDQPRIRRRLALNIQRILLGENARELTVVLSRNERLAINIATARAIGFTPTWAALTDAEQIKPERREAPRALTLAGATAEALRENLDLRANEQEVEAAEKDVRRALAGLLPQAGVSADAVVVDEDRAVASFGQQARFQTTARGSLSQMIFSDPALGNLTIQRHLQESRVYQRQALKLDVALDASVAFLQLLAAKAFERIRRDNLGVTRSNLELAQVRRSIGVAGPSEVFRWESQLAQDQSAVIAASANRNAAEIAVNRLLNRPLEEPFIAQDLNLDDPTLPTAGSKTPYFLANRWSFRKFRGFMAREGLAESPELKAIDAGIDANTRSVSVASRVFWLPQFFLQGDAAQILGQRGAGSEAPATGGFPVQDDTIWSVSAVASIPLFEGGARFADLAQAQRRLSQSEIERQALAQRIEQLIRANIHQLGASYANIGLARASAEAARKNLEVVRDAYGRGALTYLNLLDAQNAALVADLTAANAVYDCLIDFMTVQRSVSRFNILRTPEENQAFQERMRVFIDDPESE